MPREVTVQPNPTPGSPGTPGSPAPSGSPGSSVPPKPEVSGLAAWFGSQDNLYAFFLSALGYKVNVAGDVVDLTGGPRHFYDVTCGGLSPLMRKPKHGREVVNDLHGGVINLARVLVSHRGDTLQKHLQRTLNAKAIHDEALAFREKHGYLVAPSVFDVSTDHVMAAYYQFIEWWMGAGGEAGTKKPVRYSVRYTQGGGAGTRFRAAVASLDYIRWRLTGVEILNLDLFDLVGKIADEAGTLIYVDPPFLPESGGSRYEHDWPARRWSAGQASMFEDDQDPYDRLSAALHRFERATVVVRHYAHPRMDELFPPGRYGRIETTRNKQLSTASGQADTADEMFMVKRNAGVTS